MRTQLTGTVNVEVDAAPQQDLNKVLEEIRAQYESITDKHRRDQEAWFNEKVTQFYIKKKNSYTLNQTEGFISCFSLPSRPP